MTYGEPDRGHPVWSLGEEDSRPLIRHALDAGINFFDTANMYSQGSSEEILGRALRDFADRDEVVIATKVRHPMRTGPNGAGLSRKAIFTEIDNSLRRLGTDYVDLYQIHRMDNRDPDRGDAGGAARRREGRQGPLPRRLVDARLGVQQGAAPSASSTAGRGSSRCRTTTTCSPARRSARCSRSAPTRGSARSCGARSPAAGWPARGTSRPPAPGAIPLPTCSTRRESDRAIVDAVAAIATARGVSRAQVALAWLRRNPVVVAPLVGATKPSHLDDAVASLEIELTDDEVTPLEAPYTPRVRLPGHLRRRRTRPHLGQARHQARRRQPGGRAPRPDPGSGWGS